jgi:hypothetical protein
VDVLLQARVRAIFVTHLDTTTPTDLREELDLEQRDVTSALLAEPIELPFHKKVRLHRAET